MSYTPMRTSPRLDRLTYLNQKIQIPFFWGLGFLGGGLIFFAVWFYISTRKAPRPTALRALQFGVRMLAAWPAALLAAPLFPVQTPAQYLAAIFGATAAIALLPSPSVIAVVTGGLLMLDAVLGTALVSQSALSAYYLSGIRFYGIGNEYMGVLLGAALITATMLPKPEGKRWPWGLAWFALVTFVLSFPAFGAKAGGAITAVLTFKVMWQRMRGRPLRAKHMLVALGIGIGVVAVLGCRRALARAAAHAYRHGGRSAGRAALRVYYGGCFAQGGSRAARRAASRNAAGSRGAGDARGAWRLAAEAADDALFGAASGLSLGFGSRDRGLRRVRAGERFRRRRRDPIVYYDRSARAARSAGRRTLRLVALDIGEVRIGVAVCDQLEIAAFPVCTLRRVGSLKRDVEALAAVIAEQEADAVVAGLPLSLDGEVGPQAQRIQGFMKAMERATGLKTVWWDESLTSVDAHEILIAQGVSRARRRDLVDQMAAVLILDGYLEHRRRTSAPRDAIL